MLAANNEYMDTLAQTLYECNDDYFTKIYRNPQ